MEQVRTRERSHHKPQDKEGTALGRTTDYEYTVVVVVIVVPPPARSASCLGHSTVAVGGGGRHLRARAITRDAIEEGKKKLIPTASVNPPPPKKCFVLPFYDGTLALLLSYIGLKKRKQAVH